MLALAVIYFSIIVTISSLGLIGTLDWGGGHVTLLGEFKLNLVKNYEKEIYQARQKTLTEKWYEGYHISNERLFHARHHNANSLIVLKVSL